MPPLHPQAPIATTNRGPGVARYLRIAASVRLLVVTPVTSKRSACRDDATKSMPKCWMSWIGLCNVVSSQSQPLHEPESRCRMWSERRSVRPICSRSDSIWPLRSASGANGKSSRGRRDDSASGKCAAWTGCPSPSTISFDRWGVASSTSDDIWMAWVGHTSELSPQNRYFPRSTRHGLMPIACVGYAVTHEPSPVQS
jgi:hypothetical protein